MTVSVTVLGSDWFTCALQESWERGKNEEHSIGPKFLGETKKLEKANSANFSLCSLSN